MTSRVPAHGSVLRTGSTRILRGARTGDVETVIGSNIARELDASFGARDVIEPFSIKRANLHILDRSGLERQVSRLRQRSCEQSGHGGEQRRLRTSSRSTVCVTLRGIDAEQHCTHRITFYSRCLHRHEFYNPAIANIKSAHVRSAFSSGEPDRFSPFFPAGVRRSRQAIHRYRVALELPRARAPRHPKAHAPHAEPAGTANARERWQRRWGSAARYAKPSMSARSK
jgi:hypothetical protein